MIEVKTEQPGDYEILQAFPAGLGEQPLPTIIFYHGFTSSKLVYSYFAVALAQAGFRVVMPDAPEHGARFNGDEQARSGQFCPFCTAVLPSSAGCVTRSVRPGGLLETVWPWRERRWAG